MNSRSTGFSVDDMVNTDKLMIKNLKTKMIAYKYSKYTDIQVSG